MDPASLNATDDPDAPKWAVRLEAKVDIAIAGQGAEIRDVKATTVDHEDRIRKLESRPSISPKALWSVVASAAGIVLSATAILVNIHF